MLGEEDDSAAWRKGYGLPPGGGAAPLDPPVFLGRAATLLHCIYATPEMGQKVAGTTPGNLLNLRRRKTATFQRPKQRSQNSSRALVGGGCAQIGQGSSTLDPETIRDDLQIDHHGPSVAGPPKFTKFYSTNPTTLYNHDPPAGAKTALRGPRAGPPGDGRLLASRMPATAPYRGVAPMGYGIIRWCFLERVLLYKRRVDEVT